MVVLQRQHSLQELRDIFPDRLVGMGNNRRDTEGYPWPIPPAASAWSPVFLLLVGTAFIRGKVQATVFLIVDIISSAGLSVVES